MIPLKLQIKNFLSYGAETQTIDFGIYNLICLSGKNGHGKSALLDAITWALWGHARKLSGTAKADQGLLRLGQTQMMVCLDLVCNNQYYRIRREFMQTYGKPVTLLDFGLLEPNTDKYISLTEKTIRDTQAKIDSMLHLTFEAFINSAFLRQGQANEFSKKSPKERKEVLAAILGIDRYEMVRKLASDRMRHIGTQKIHLASISQKLEQELAQGATISQQLLELQEQQKNITSHEQQLLNQIKELDQEYQNLSDEKQKLVMLEYQAQQLLQEQETSYAKLKELYYQWRTIHRHLLHQKDFTQLEEQKKILINDIARHQQSLQNQLILKQKLLTLKEQCTQRLNQLHEEKSIVISDKKRALERLLLEKRQSEQTIEHLKQTRIKIETALQNLVKEQQLAPAVDHELPNKVKNIERQFEKRKEHYQRWIALANMLNTQIQASDQKNRLVHDERAPSCPLCEQNLSASRKRFLKKKFETEIYTHKRNFVRLSSLIKRLKPVVVEQHTLLEDLKKQFQEQQIIALKKAEINIRIQQYEHEKNDYGAQLTKQQELLSIQSITIDTESIALQKTIENHKNELENDSIYQDYKKELAKIEFALQNANYNPAIHEKLTKELSFIEQQIELYKDIQNQQLFQNQRSQAISQLCKQIKASKTHYHQLMKECSHKERVLTAQNNNQAQKKILLDQCNTLNKTKEQLLEQKGSLENQKNKLDQMRQEHSQTQKELTQCTRTIEDYQAIAQATGKDGIQALLIEDAIPEIEQETNDLLAKLTDNQTQLFIESLRDLKKGGTKETLDIKISDATGIRPYELFSGGEAFRIDFALRIAISKLLARRSGTALQTLIIDEGFGSQDEEGLSAIMDCLYKIQDDFAKIIIVSHLPSMKNQFPVHFVIEKGPQGSVVEILEQG